jgi:hypothetical protein
MPKSSKKPAAAKAPKEEVQIAFKSTDGNEHSLPLKVPVAPGAGEAVINQAEKLGCADIEAVRAQVRKHYA